MSTDAIAKARNEDIHDAGMVKGIGLTTGTTLVMGSMIGSGVFIVAADIARVTGSPALLIAAWVVTGFMTVSAALTVMKPVTTQAAMSSAGEPVMRAMSAATMNTPEPIIEPITSVVPVVRPMPLTNPVSWMSSPFLATAFTVPMSVLMF